MNKLYLYICIAMYHIKDKLKSTPHYITIVLLLAQVRFTNPTSSFVFRCLLTFHIFDISSESSGSILTKLGMHDH